MRNVRHIMLMELPDWQLVVVSAIVGIVWAATMFDWSFVAGTNPYWQFPTGLITDSQKDMAQVLIANYAYAQAPWGFPLFDVSTLNVPIGANVIMMDAVPIVALIAKLIHSIGHVLINPYGAFLFLCFVLPGVMMTLVLRATRIRYVVAVIVGAVFADTMPQMLFRWGHIALEAQFLIIGALALYLFSLRESGWRGVRTVWVLFLVLTYLINLHLFVVVGLVWLCAVVQRWLDRRMSMRNALGYGILCVVVVLVVSAIGGQFSHSDLPYGEYGKFSMNLLSPFVPWVPDGTGGQYEGYNYLGRGLLLATVLVLPVELDWLRHNIGRHVALLIAILALVAFAISHRVYFGHWLLFEVPLPYVINRALGAFRSSGRFFWLAAYVQMIVVIVLAFRHRSWLAIAVVLAAILQIAAVQPLRQQIVANVDAGPRKGPFDYAELVRLVTAAHFVDIIPSYHCIDGDDLATQLANIEVMLASSRAGVPTNSVYMSRVTYGLTLREVLRAPSRASPMLAERRIEHCIQESEQAAGPLRPGEVRVLLADQPQPQGATCAPLSGARYCVP